LDKPSASKRRIYALCLLPVIAVIAIAFLVVYRAHPGANFASSQPRLTQSTTPAARAHLRASFAALPLAFEKNQGQTDPQVQYMARANGYTLFLTNNDAVFSFHSRSSAIALNTGRRLQASHAPSRGKAQQTAPAVVRMQLVGGNPVAPIAAIHQLPGRSNYYLGSDPKKWQTNVPQYARVAYKNVYPGVDLAYYGEQSKLEFDFVVAPQSSPAPIDLEFRGARSVATDASGNLVVSSAAGDVVLHQPVAYQEQNGSRQLVDSRFVLKANKQVSFELGNYDHSRDLVIDPTVTYATYLGGSAEDDAYGVAVDSSGNAYVTGGTLSLNFPGTATSTKTNFVAFVSVLNPAGSALVSTFLGGTTGSGDNFGLGIAVNSTGAYVVGDTNSSSFPGTLIGPGGGKDAFVAKLSTSGTLTLLQVARIGGTGDDVGNGIAIDSTGAAYIGGDTDSTDFPTAGPAIQTTNGGSIDGFVAKLDVSGTSLDYSDYIGGSGNDPVESIALDGSNNAYITGITTSSNFPITPGAYQRTQSGTGDNGFVAAVKADGSALIYSTYLGGTGSNDALAIAVDSAGEAYVTGDTSSSNFPTLNPVQASLKGATDVFITKLNASGTGLLFSTYVGGTLDDAGTGIALDSFNDVYVTGTTQSSDYPTNGTPFQASLSGTSDAFVTELSNTGFSVYSSFLGGTGNENSVGEDLTDPLGAIAVDAASNVYLAGSTSTATGSGFPITTGAFQSTYGGGASDAFVTKVGAAPADFSVAVSPTTISVASGQTTAAITVTVSSVNAAFGNAVTLSCGGKPANAACNFSPLSVTPGATAATSNLTISTNGSTGNGMLIPTLGRRSLFYAMLLPVGGVVFLGVGLGRRNRKLVRIIAPTLMVGILIILPACGGSSSGGGGGATCAAVPSVPTGLAASSTTSTGTTLTWTAATAGANCSVTGYTIYQAGQSIGTSPTTTFNVTGLSPSTTYNFTVAATDSFGTSAQSSPALSVTTTGPATAAGTYTIMVTGTDANNVAHSAPLTLIVN
jgi:Fibronectin type III domain/Beta-propeller repeat